MPKLKSILAALLIALPASAALENTWVTSPNNTLDSTSTTTSAKNQLWMMYAALTGVSSVWANATAGATPANPWTVWCSSDGSGTAGVPHLPTDNCATSHNDAWTSTYTAANLVRAAAGSNHSWMVLKSAAAGGYPAIYMLIDWSTATDQTVTISFSKTQFLCAANPCLATTAPTQANKWNHTSYQFNVASVATQNRLHFSVDSYGSFWFEPSRDGNAFSGIRPLLGVFIKDYKSADVIPFLSTVADPCTPPAGGTTANTWSDNDTAAMGWQGRTYTDGGAAQIGAAGLYVMRNSLSTTRTLGSASQTATISSADGIDSKWDDLPIYLFDNTSNALRGRLPDIRWAGQSIPTGSVGPSPGPYTNMAIAASSSIGNCTVANLVVSVWLPYVNASVPLL